MPRSTGSGSEASAARARGRLRVAVGAVCSLAVLAACAGTPEALDADTRRATAPEAPKSNERVRLAEAAFDRGDLELAETRFRRVLASSPDSAAGHLGIGRVELERGHPEMARPHLEASLRVADGADVRLGLGAVERAARHPSEARAHLDRAVELDDSRPDVHEALADLTGLSPRPKRLTANQAIRLANDHPYDPWILVRAGRAISGRDPDAAAAYFGRAIWLADVDPASARGALRLLARVSPAWASRGFVPVTAYADDAMRSRPGWRFEIRSLWVDMSNTLSEVLGIQFMPLALRELETETDSGVLKDIHAAFVSKTKGETHRGIVAAFTGTPTPRGPGYHLKGVAEYLGRKLTVRVTSRGSPGRTLAHEVLHLYGAIHANDDLDSVMNPTGEARRLDRPNYRIVRSIRGRRFRDEPLEQTLLPYIDLSETADAYVAALSVNLYFRRLDLAHAAATRRLPRIERAEVKRIRDEDPLLADVSRMAARLLRRDRRSVEALSLLRTSAALYGRDTPRGRSVANEADLLEARLREILLR